MSKHMAKTANRENLAHRRAEQVFTRASLTVSETARICRMSVNTVKKVVFKHEGHPNSAIRLQRGLEDYIQKKKSADEDVASLVLTGHGTHDSVMLIKKLLEVLKDTAMLDADDEQRFKPDELRQAQKLITACDAMLPAASLN